MKKLLSITLISILGVVAGLTATTSLNQNKAKEVLAAEGTTKGLYERIDASDLASLTSDDRVLLITGGGSAHDTFERVYYSNPRRFSYCALTDTGAYITYDRAVLNACNAEELVVSAGTVSGSYSFKGTSTFDGLYIADTFNESYQGLQTTSSHSAYSSWTFEPHDRDGKTYYYMKNMGRETYCYVNYNSEATFNDQYSGASFLIYKKVPTSSVVVSQTMDQTTYYKGDKLNLSGLEIDVRINVGVIGDWVTIKYNDAPGIFKPTNEYASTTFPYVTINTPFGGVNVEIDVTENPNHTFTKVTGPLADYRGSYMIVKENGDGTGLAWNTALGYDDINEYGNHFNVVIDNNKVLNPSYEAEHHTFKIERKIADGNPYYFAKMANGKYLNYPDSSYYFHIDLTDNTTKYNQVTFNMSSLFPITIGNGYSVFFKDYGDDTRAFSVYESILSVEEDYNKPYSIYKYDETDEISAEIESFCEAFDDVTTDYCDYNASTSDITSLAANWSSLASAFSALSVDAQGYFASLTYTHDGETDDSPADIVDRYDYILSKYQTSNSLEDFMFRQSNTSYQNNSTSSNRITVIDSLNETNISMWIIVTISLVLITSLPVLLIIKKKRQ